MSKKIIICSDGTWNRPENDLKEDFPSNVLRLSRAIKPVLEDGVTQQVFYDWGVGSYYDPIIGGASGSGVQKNIMDCYRYIVQNYSPGDELYFFGFSRGSYTIRSLCGLINNCGIIKRNDARLIQKAFNHYKKAGIKYSPKGEESIKFRDIHSHRSRVIKFVGVWDTVGAMGIPISFLGLFDEKDEFYDTKIGNNVLVARHALAIDEHRSDFEPTIWNPKENIDLQQVWFSGAHSNIGGSYKPDRDSGLLSDIPLKWMLREAAKFGLVTEPHLNKSIKINPLSRLHNSRRSFYRVKGKYYRPIEHNKGPVFIHESVKYRWNNDSKYRPKNLVEYVREKGWSTSLVK